jgi:hypothetical protein
MPVMFVKRRENEMSKLNDDAEKGEKSDAK